jgi:epoxyqueuosine reductase
MRDPSSASASSTTHRILPQKGDARISRYAWGNQDYHVTMREALARMVARLLESRSLLEDLRRYGALCWMRTFARLAGLGWIGKNTCLINEPLGSWFFWAKS